MRSRTEPEILWGRHAVALEGAGGDARRRRSKRETLKIAMQRQERLGSIWFLKIIMLISLNKSIYEDPRAVAKSLVFAARVDEISTWTVLGRSAAAVRSLCPRLEGKNPYAY